MTTHTTTDMTDLTITTARKFDGLPAGLVTILLRLGYSQEETIALLEMDALMGSTLGHHTVPKIAAYFEALYLDMTGETR